MQSSPSSKAQSLSRASHKAKGNQKTVKKRTANCASQPWQTHKQQADFGHTWKKGTRKAQTSPDCTQPIQDMVRSQVRGKRAWFGSWRGERPILRFLLGLFWGKCPVGMTYHPKEVKLSWNLQVHAMRYREREGTQTIAGKGATADKQTKQFSFVWQWGMAHKRTSGGRQVHPDQKKIVEGQNSKIQSRQTL